MMRRPEVAWESNAKQAMAGCWQEVQRPAQGAALRGQELQP